MRSCTLCFVPPLNIIICPISGCIARAAGGWSVLILLHQPTTARCLYYVLRPILHVRISCLYLYCTAVSLCLLPIFSYLHRHPHHRCCCLSSSNKQLRYHDVPNRPSRTYDDKFQKAAYKTRVTPTFPRTVTCAHGRLPGDKKVHNATIKEVIEIRDRIISRVRHLHGLRLL